MKSIMKLFVAACLTLALAGVASAQTATSAGSFYVAPTGGVYGFAGKNASTMWTYGGQAGFFVIDGLSLSAEVTGASFRIKKDSWWVGNSQWKDVGAVATNFLVHYHYQPTDMVSLFAGAGIGGTWSDQKIPVNGSTSNLNLLGEAGVAVYFTRNVGLKLAGRYEHIGEFNSDRGLNAWGGNGSLVVTF